MQLSLATKFAVLALIVAGAGVAGVAYVSYRDAGGMLRRQALRDIAHDVARETAILAAQIETAGQDARFLAAAPPVEGIVDALAGGTNQGPANDTAEDWRERLKGLFSTVLRQRPSYQQIRLIGLSGNGREVVRVDRLAGKIVVTAEANLQEKGHRPYFKEIVKLGPGQLYFSDVNLNREHGRISLPRWPALRVGVPVFGADGRDFGALVVNVNFKTLTEAILPLTEGKKFFITNDRGYYLYHPVEGKAFAFETGGRGNISDDFPGVDVLSDARPQGAFAGAAVEDIVSLDLPGHSVGLVFQHLHYDPANAERIFVLGALAPHSAIDRATLKFRDRLLGLVLVVAAVLSIAVLVFTRVLTRPIRELTQVANRIAAGEEGVAIPSVGDPRFGGTDEVGVLSGSMRSMLEHLEESRGELRQLAGSLEHQVEERTRELRDSEAGLRAITEASPVPLVITRRSDGKILYANPRVGPAFGLAADEVIGRSMTEFYGNPSEREERLSALDKDGYVHDSEVEMRKADGSPISTIHSLQAIEYQGEEAVLGGFYDISERKHLEEQLRHAQKMEAVGQLTGGVAHDFNNLMAIMINNAELLKDGVGEDEEAKGFIEEIMAAIDRGSSLTGRLLAFSRQTPLSPVATDVSELIGGLHDMLQRTLGETVGLKVEGTPDLWPATIDPHQFENALVNLAINARDAMPQGGTLVIETANATLDKTYAEQHDEVTPGDYAMVAVSDSGTGMPPEVLEKAFEPFFTTKEAGEGSGLGLSMVYGFVKQSKGHITIYSELDHGTTVKLYLPRSREGAAKTDAENDALEFDRGSERILVVEDDPAVRKGPVKILRDHGYQVVEAGNGAEAIDRLKIGPAYDLLFTDVVLPGGMNGVEVAVEAKRLQPSIKVLYATGYAENAVVHSGRLDPGVTLVNKPYRRRELLQKVRAVLDSEGD